MKARSKADAPLREWMLFAGAGIVVGAMLNMALGGQALLPGGLLGGLVSGVLVRFLA